MSKNPHHTYTLLLFVSKKCAFVLTKHKFLIFLNLRLLSCTLKSHTMQQSEHEQPATFTFSDAQLSALPPPINVLTSLNLFWPVSENIVQHRFTDELTVKCQHTENSDMQCFSLKNTNCANSVGTQKRTHRHKHFQISFQHHTNTSNECLFFMILFSMCVIGLQTKIPTY